jgi:hypothetical protein
VQKLLYAVLMMTRKLKHYSLAHTIWVVSDRPLAHVQQSKEATGRIAQWAMEIVQYDVEFVLGGRSSLKRSHILLLNGQIQMYEASVICPIIG